MANNKEKKDNKERITIKQLIFDKQKRSILILAVYAILFVCLILGLNNSSTSTSDKPNNYDKEIADKINNDDSLESINISNYEYTYTIIKDNKTYVYKGKTYGSKQLFTNDGKDYYKSLNTYLIKDKTSWSLTKSPYVYEEYIDFNNLNNILKKSNFVSSNTYDDGVVFNSYYMFVDGIVSKNMMNLYSKDNHLAKVEVSLINGDSITIDISNINKIDDFEIK